MGLIETLTIRLQAESAGVKHACESAANAFETLNHTIEHTKEFLAGIFIANEIAEGVHKLAEGLYDCGKAFAESERAAAQFDAVMKSTQNASRISSEQIKELSESLENVSEYSHVATTKLATLLGQFDKLKGQNFIDTIKAVQNISARLGGEPSDYALKIGRALEDPRTAGRTLRKMGVIINDDDQKQIGHYVYNNQYEKAQQIILKQLDKQYGGAAAANTNDLLGKSRQLSNSFEALKESIGRSTGFLVTWTDKLRGGIEYLNGKPTGTTKEELEGQVAASSSRLKWFGGPFGMQWFARNEGAYRQNAQEKLEQLENGEGPDKFKNKWYYGLNDFLKGNKENAQNWFSRNISGKYPRDEKGDVDKSKVTKPEFWERIQRGFKIAEPAINAALWADEKYYGKKAQIEGIRKHLQEANFTPAEQFAHDMKELNKLYGEGKVDPKTYGRIADKARFEFDKQNLASAQPVSAAIKGSQEAFEAIARRNNESRPTSVLEKGVNDLIKKIEDGNKFLGDIKDGIEKIAAPVQEQIG